MTFVGFTWFDIFFCWVSEFNEKNNIPTTELKLD